MNVDCFLPWEQNIGTTKADACNVQCAADPFCDYAVVDNGTCFLKGFLPTCKTPASRPSQPNTTKSKTWSFVKKNSDIASGGQSKYIDQLSIVDCVARCNDDAKCRIAVVRAVDGDGGTPGKRTCYHRLGEVNATIQYSNSTDWYSFVKPLPS